MACRSPFMRGSPVLECRRLGYCLGALLLYGTLGPKDGTKRRHLRLGRRVGGAITSAGAACLAPTARRWPGGPASLGHVEVIQAIPAAVAAGPEVCSMTSPLKMTVYRPAGRLVRTCAPSRCLRDGSAGRGVGAGFRRWRRLVPVCFGDPVLVEDWDRVEVPFTAVVGPRSTPYGCGSRAGSTRRMSRFPRCARFVAADVGACHRMASPDDVWPHDFREAVAEPSHFRRTADLRVR